MPGKFTRDIQPPLLWVLVRGSSSRYGAVALYRAPFQETSREHDPLGTSPNTTLPVRASVWAVSLSLAVSHDIAVCFLFLSLLRCFNSGRSPLRKAIAVRIPIRRSPVLRLRATPWSLSQLGTSFVGSRAEPFTSWHSSQLMCNHCDPMNGSSGRLDCTYTRSHHTSRCLPRPCSTLPNRALAGWCIGLASGLFVAPSHT